MRVVCIDESCYGRIEGPSVKKGNVYTVLEARDISGFKLAKGQRPEKGEYYVLVEMGDRYAYHHSLFIPINEDQQDETEMERELIESHQIQG